MFEDNVDYPDREPPFVEGNVAVDNAIVKAQQLRFQASTQGANLGADPHKGLNDLRAKSDKQNHVLYM
jgi:hypothetical protein